MQAAACVGEEGAHARLQGRRPSLPAPVVGEIEGASLPWARRPGEGGRPGRAGASLAGASRRRRLRAVFWLDRALRGGCRRILDVGGNIGVHYFAYQHLLAYPDELVWTVCEVQAIAEAGRRLAAARGARRLRFASPLTAALVEEADVLLAAGSLQYIERPQLHELLGAARRKPRHLLLNKLPIYDGEAFVSLQNIRRGYAPHYVYGRRSFTEPLLAQGYEVRDAWTVPERSFWLPGRPERSFRAYTGLYLARAG